MKRLIRLVRRHPSLALAAVLVLTPALASAVPITDPMNYGFYSIQLRGISYDPLGELVGVHLWDQTWDADAYGSLKITDLDTNQVLLNFVGGNYGNYAAPGTFDVAPFLLPYNHQLQYEFRGQEFSQVALILGDTIVGIGGTHNGVYPTYTTTEVITAVPEPGAWLLFTMGIAAAAVRRRAAKG